MKTEKRKAAKHVRKHVQLIQTRQPRHQGQHCADHSLFFSKRFLASKCRVIFHDTDFGTMAAMDLSHRKVHSSRSKYFSKVWCPGSFASVPGNVLSSQLEEPHLCLVGWMQVLCDQKNKSTTRCLLEFDVCTAT